jgi:hypothetical protein
MRAYLVNKGKFGGRSKPKSTVDAIVVLIKEVQAIKNVLTQMLDSFRAVVSCVLPLRANYTNPALYSTTFQL